MLIYLASPYSSCYADVRHKRVVCAKYTTSKLLQAGHLVFSPVVYSTTLLEADRTLTDKHDYWMKFDLELLERFDELWVLCIDGWSASKGVAEEVKAALRLGKPVRYIDTNLCFCAEVKK